MKLRKGIGIINNNASKSLFPAPTAAKTAINPIDKNIIVNNIARHLHPSLNSNSFSEKLMAEDNFVSKFLASCSNSLNNVSILFLYLSAPPLFSIFKSKSVFSFTSSFVLGTIK